MQDKSGMFEDFNFKLVVINSLLEQEPSFMKELEKLEEEYVDNYEWYAGQGVIPQIEEFFANLVLTKEDLSKVTELFFDGGSDVYLYLLPDWDGEDDWFDVTSVKGFEHLPNLKIVNWSAMCNPEVLEPFKEKGIEVNL